MKLTLGKFARVVWIDLREHTILAFAVALQVGGARHGVTGLCPDPPPSEAEGRRPQTAGGHPSRWQGGQPHPLPGHPLSNP